MSGLSFLEFMRKETNGFDGTSFCVVDGGTELGSFNIARYPQASYWEKLLKIFEVAVKYDSTIELSIAFCIRYHQSIYSDSSLANNKIFTMKVEQIIKIPSNVLRFFQFLPVKELYDRFEKLKSDIESSKLKLKSLTDLEKTVGASFKEISDEIAQLQLEMGQNQSDFEKVNDEFAALKRLELAFTEVKHRLGFRVDRLEVSSSLSFLELMADTQEKRDFLSQKLKVFSEIRSLSFLKQQELKSLQETIQSLLEYLGKAKQDLVKVQKDFLTSFEHLYPRTIKVYTRGDCAAYLGRIESTIRGMESCNSDWRFFHYSDCLWYKQMPVLFGLMMTEMVKTSLSKSRRLKPTHLISFHELFGKLPRDMQKLYLQHRFLIIEHSFLLILSSKLTNTCRVRQYSLTIQMRFLAKLAKKLILGLEFKKLHGLSISI
jgi:hypothetical protein